MSAAATAPSPSITIHLLSTSISLARTPEFVSFPKLPSSNSIFLRCPFPSPPSSSLSSAYFRATEDESDEIEDLFSDKPREECGVFGIIGDPEASRIASLGLHALQHRGQEGAGIVSCDDKKLKSVTGLGLVSEVFNSKNLNTLNGSAAIAHVRYATSGGSSSVLNVQPFMAGYRFGQLAVAHNGNLVNYKKLRSQLESNGSIFNTSSDTEVVLHLIAHSNSPPFITRLMEACEALEGAYSFLFLADNKLFAVRDPYGFRPLVMGRRPNGAIVFASETCALDLIDAHYEREVHPGEVIMVDGDDNMSISSFYMKTKKVRKACIFEHIYFALPNSIVFGRSVYSSRLAFGETLASESPVPNADVVIPVPDSGFFAALGYANKSGVPFQQGLIRSHYVTRTFIQPTQELRDLAVKLKLAPVPGVIKGKVVVVIDDSIVRGTTSKKIVRLLYNAGAKEVHMRVASPPIVGSCYYGVDTPSSEELVSNRMDVDGVRKMIGCDTLAFLSLVSLKGLLGEEADTFCDACFTMNYPVSPVMVNEAEREMVNEAERELVSADRN